MTQIDAPNFRAIGPDGTLNWALKTSAGMGPYAPAPTVTVDRVILPDTPDAWIVDKATGEVLYKTQLHPSGGRSAYPVVTDGRIHTGFSAFSLETGDQVWSAEIEEPKWAVVQPDGSEFVKNAGPTGIAPAVSDGTVYVAGTLYDGETRFYREDAVTSEQQSSLLHSGEIAGSYRDEYDEWGHVHALDADTGSPEWTRKFDTPVRDRTPPVTTERTVYVVDTEPRLRALERTSGRELWNVAFDTETLGGWRPAVANDRVLVCAGNELHAFDAHDGTETWNTNFDTQLAGPPALADGVVHVSTSDGTVAAIDFDGTRRWELSVGESLRTGPVITNSRIYVAGREVVCLASRAD
ncbi:outer membrane protein assembly factor BamB family protein [Halovivax ruber]|nr:PQQ-binding-like beta-propeller repeat protein [Halovivax ruber]